MSGGRELCSPELPRDRREGNRLDSEPSRTSDYSPPYVHVPCTIRCHRRFPVSQRLFVRLLPGNRCQTSGKTSRCSAQRLDRLFRGSFSTMPNPAISSCESPLLSDALGVGVVDAVDDLVL